MKKTVVYIATHCQPCEEIKRLLEKGHFLVNGTEGEVELIDIETDEGFKRMDETDKVPSAYQDGKACKILIDEDSDTLLLECQNEDKR